VLQGGRVCIPLYTLTVKSLHTRGPLSHKKGCLIHQFLKVVVVLSLDWDGLRHLHACYYLIHKEIG
jgi:hypothetical protein